MARRLVSLADFEKAPVGQMAASEHVLVWFPDARLRVFAFWDAPTVQDMCFTQNALEAALSRDVATHGALIDMRRVTAFHDAVVADYARELVERRAEIAARISRSVVLVTNNAIGARARVLHSLVRLPYDWDVTEDPAEAMEWLQVQDLDVRVFTTLDQRIDLLRSTSGLLRRGREIIRQEVNAGQRLLTLADAASDLGVSGRSLQRAFAAAGTSYRAELRRAQIERAMQLLSETDMNLTGIALSIGFQKVDSLNRLFSVELGITPSQWRSRCHSS